MIQFTHQCFAYLMVRANFIKFIHQIKFELSLLKFFILHSRFRFCLKMILAGLKILSFNDQEYFSLKIIMFSSNLKDFIAQVDGQKEHYKMF